MPIHVDDPADPRLDIFRAARPHTFFVESELAVQRLLASREVFRTIGLLGTAAHLERLAADCPTYTADRPLLRAVVGFDLHRGVIACAERPRELRRDLSHHTCPIAPVGFALDDLLARPAWTVLLVHRLADPANLGSIVRSARALGVDLVLLDRRGADPLERRSIRAAMGHVFAQPLALTADLTAAVRLLRSRGGVVWAATVGPRARDIAAVHRSNRLVLCVGNEGDGLPPDLCDLADLEVTVPIADGVDSLGVAAATAVLLHTVRRPGRGEASPPTAARMAYHVPPREPDL